MKKLIFAFAIIFCTVAMAYALSDWTDALTYKLKAGDSWKTTTTSGYDMGQDKNSDANYFDVNTVSKTMSSKPSFRLVNSNNEVRSNSVTTANTGLYVRGSGNTGVIGYSYYGSIKPAWNQLGTDTIKLQMRIY